MRPPGRGLQPKPRKLAIGVPRIGDRDESEVRWLISYSDFMMQLVCLFILLYSVSSLDRGRMAKMAASYRASIGIGDLAAHDTKTSGDRLAVGDRSLLGGELGGGDVPRELKFRVEPVAGGFRVAFDGTLFERGSSALTGPGAEAVDGAARVIGAYAGPAVVTASADEAGADGLRLSLARAEAVVSRLTRPGFARALDPRFLAASARPSGEPGRVTIRVRTE